MDSLLKATAVAMVFAVLAATAEAGPGSYVPAIATAGFLMSPVFLWVAANAIVVAIWLLSSSRGGSTNDATSSPRGDDGEAVHDAADSLYTSSSEYEYFSDAGSARRAADAPPVSRRLAREARRADRPRVRKKPAVQDDAPGTRRAVAAAAAREPDDERRGAETHVAFAAAADGVDGEDEDVSMDSLWQSIVQRRAARRELHPAAARAPAPAAAGVRAAPAPAPAPPPAGPRPHPRLARLRGAAPAGRPAV
ncbi:uncharacterized protein C2845_PM02G10960 [Panicum miliaceum]|uniref:DUF4408 domain-containing protein n=1 Tax=Panicum miliaceum TaxID=4540 RepID=A0A3L6S7K6_PANMI|nr:uncharacterized protein C2845_PM02G10960 [Panicum miliaceum]